MSWTCPDCHETDNQDGINRCICGYELPLAEPPPVAVARPGKLALGVLFLGMICLELFAASMVVAFWDNPLLSSPLYTYLAYGEIAVCLLTLWGFVLYFSRKRSFPDCLALTALLHMLIAAVATNRGLFISIELAVIGMFLAWRIYISRALRAEFTR